MKTFLSAVVLTAILFLCSGSTAKAQANFYNVNNSPAVSPYLRLLQPNGFGVVTYQGDVKPQLDARDALIQQGQQINQLQQQAKSLESRSYRNTSLHQTGIGAHYLNYSHYYSGIRERYAR